METAIKARLKAAELRVGNYLHTQLTHMQKETTQPLVVMVDEIKYLKAALSYMQGAHLTMNRTHLFYSELSGMPLTPKLLEKCGFTYQFIASDKRLVFDTGRGFIYSYYEGSISINLYDADKKWIGETRSYLHQLQNLHFALTGEELKVNF